MGECDPVSRAASEVHLGSAFAESVLGTPLTTADALAAVRTRVQARNALFLDTIERAVFAHGDSPYRPLLATAGYDLDRVRALVAERGVEETLRQLCRDGVYLTIEEFKGLEDTRRGGRSFRLGDQAFHNPLIVDGLPASSGGTRTGSVTSTISSSNLRMGAEHLALAVAAYGLEGRSMIVWLPQAHGASHWAVLALAAIGAPPGRMVYAASRSVPRRGTCAPLPAGGVGMGPGARNLSGQADLRRIWANRGDPRGLSWASVRRDHHTQFGSARGSRRQAGGRWSLIRDVYYAGRAADAREAIGYTQCRRAGLFLPGFHGVRARDVWLRHGLVRRDACVRRCGRGG